MDDLSNNFLILHGFSISLFVWVLAYTINYGYRFILRVLSC